MWNSVTGHRVVCGLVLPRYLYKYLYSDNDIEFSYIDIQNTLIAIKYTLIKQSVLIPKALCLYFQVFTVVLIHAVFEFHVIVYMAYNFHMT